MEPIRRSALVEATIHEVGARGTLDVTVSQIAKRAGMSSALAHHYFGGKDDIFLAAMRRILSGCLSTMQSFYRQRVMLSWLSLLLNHLKRSRNIKS